jgi:hypothetical protein
MATYYVSLSGNDSNDGLSVGAAWLTARKASRTIVPGDTVYFVATNDATTEFVETAGPSIDGSTATVGGWGTSFLENQKIVFAAYPGDEGLIVLKRDTASGSAVVDLRAHSAASAVRFVEFYNLIFDGYKNSTSAKAFIPIYINSSPRTDNAPHDIRFFGCEVRNSAQSSGWFTEASSTNAAGIPYNLLFTKSSTRRGKAYNNGTTTSQHGIYMQGRDSEISYIDVYGNFGLGIQVHRDTPHADNCKNILINACRAYDNGQTGIYYGKGADGKIYNCLAYDNATHGIRFDDGASNGQIYNCTSVRNVTSNFATAQTAAVTSIAITNCIARKLGVTTNNLSEGSSGAQLTITNCINIALTDTDATDPLFTDVNADDFTLQSTSPARNSGTSLIGSFSNDLLGTLRPQEAEFDKGAFEYIPTSESAIIRNSRLGSSIFNWRKGSNLFGGILTRFISSGDSTGPTILYGLMGR